MSEVLITLSWAMLFGSDYLNIYKLLGITSRCQLKTCLEFQNISCKTSVSIFRELEWRSFCICFLSKRFFFHKKLCFKKRKENTKKSRKIPSAQAIKSDESLWSIQNCGLCVGECEAAGRVVVLVCGCVLFKLLKSIEGLNGNCCFLKLNEAFAGFHLRDCSWRETVSHACKLPVKNFLSPYCDVGTFCSIFCSLLSSNSFAFFYENKQENIQTHLWREKLGSLCNFHFSCNLNFTWQEKLPPSNEWGMTRLTKIVLIYGNDCGAN